MAGQLKSNALTELIREISAGGLSGALRLARERAKTVIYFDTGSIIHAASNVRAYRLIESVRRWNVLDESELAGVQGETADEEFGQSLVEAGVLDREKLVALITRQVSELLFHTLLWTDGEWDFDPRVRLAGDTRVTIKARKLLVESARHLPVDFVATRLMNQSEKLLPVTEAPVGVDLMPNEAFVLTRVDTPITIDELLSVSGLAKAETLQAIYTLALGGFLIRESWPLALSAEAAAQARANKEASSKKATAAAQAASERDAPSEEPRDEQSEIQALFARIHSAADHYQLIGVRRLATPGDVKTAYYALAKRFHPDRFRRNAAAADLARIESAFAQIAQAYETLKDKTSRAVYDSKLYKQEEAVRASRASGPLTQLPTEASRDASNRPVSGPLIKPQPADTPYQAEERFKQGVAALQQGNHAFAIASLGEAARLAPTEPRYRAYLGSALSKNERLRHSAELEFKAAIALDTKNASYRVMLAEFYSEIGLNRRAQTELDGAFSVDPQNKDARRLRDKLKSKG